MVSCWIFSNEKKKLTATSPFDKQSNKQWEIIPTTHTHICTKCLDCCNNYGSKHPLFLTHLFPVFLSFIFLSLKEWKIKNRSNYRRIVWVSQKTNNIWQRCTHTLPFDTNENNSIRSIIIMVHPFSPFHHENFYLVHIPLLLIVFIEGSTENKDKN